LAHLFDRTAKRIETPGLNNRSGAWIFQYIQFLMNGFGNALG